MAESRAERRSRRERWTIPVVGLAMVLVGGSLIIDEDDVDIRALGVLAVVLGALEIGIGIVMWRRERRTAETGQRST